MLPMSQAGCLPFSSRMVILSPSNIEQCLETVIVTTEDAVLVSRRERPNLLLSNLQYAGQLPQQRAIQPNRQ